MAITNCAMPARRPTIALAVRSPTALCNLVASLAMLACLLFPQMKVEPLGDGNRVVAVIGFWPFALALCTLGVFLMLVRLRPPWFARALLWLPIGFAIALSIGWSIVLFSDAEDSRLAMVIAAIVLPLGTLVSLRMLWLYRAGQVTAAAAWGQGFLCVLAIFSLRWFWIPPVIKLLLGGWLSIASMGLMMAASWTWITRAEHDLFDRNSPPLPLQVSLRQIVVAIAFTAIALTYWRYLEDSSGSGLPNPPPRTEKNEADVVERFSTPSPP